MAIALFATFVNQTPLFGNGAAGGRKTLGENNRVMDSARTWALDNIEVDNALIPSKQATYVLISFIKKLQLTPKIFSQSFIYH